MYRFWEKYRDQRIGTTAIEENFVKTLRGDEALVARAEAYGTHMLYPHTTARGKHGKWDEEYGIAALVSLFGTGLIAFANSGPGDLAKLQPLIEDLLIFPWSDEQDAAIALWLCEGAAANIQPAIPSQAEIKARRGVPDVVSRRSSRYASHK
jgi:hypothetical protein